MKKCFFAYSDKENKVSDSILEAVNSINGSDYIHITPWNAMEIDGNSIPLTVINSIDDCNYFLCE